MYEQEFLTWLKANQPNVYRTKNARALDYWHVYWKNTVSGKTQTPTTNILTPAKTMPGETTFTPFSPFSPYQTWKPQVSTPPKPKGTEDTAATWAKEQAQKDFNDFLTYIKTNYARTPIGGINVTNYTNHPLYAKYQEYLNAPTAPLLDPNAPTEVDKWNYDLALKQYQLQLDKFNQDKIDAENLRLWNEKQAAQSGIDKWISWSQGEKATLEAKKAAEEEQKRQFANMFDPAQRAAGWRAEMDAYIAKMTGPGDWIKRWFAQNTPNPYAETPQSQAGSQASILSNVTIPQLQSQLATQSQARVSQIAGNNYTPAQSAWQAEQAGGIGATIASLAKAQESLSAWLTQAGTPTPAVQGPPTPPNMARFAGVPTGTSLPRWGTVTPVGAEDFTRMSTTDWSALYGLGEHWGQPGEDIYKQAQTMIPSGNVRGPTGRKAWTARV